MSWQFIIIAQILVSTLMTLYTRRVTLSTRSVFFGIGVLSYCAVAVTGLLYGIVATGGQLAVPPANVWLYLIIEGICIPAAWLMNYKLISHIGASSAVVANTLNMAMTALGGIIFLGEPISVAFVVGSLLVMGGIVVTLRLRPDVRHTDRMSLWVKIGLVLVSTLLYATGMVSEKIVVDAAGPWNYMAFGWMMQALGALVLFAWFGRKEMQHISPRVIKKGVILGVATGIAGALYIYAVSIGSLSHTIIAASGKVVLVMIVAALLFGEHNAWPQRIIAFILAVSGLMLIVGW